MDFFQKPKILTTVIIILFVLNLGTIGFLVFHRPPRHEKCSMRCCEQMCSKEQGCCQKDGFEQRQHGFEPMQHNPGGFLEEQLNFNDKQKEEFSKLRDEHHKQVTELQDSIKSLKDKLYTLVITADESKLNSISAAIGDDQRKIELATVNHFQKVRALCDDSQKKKFDDVIKDVIKMLDMRGPIPSPEMRNHMWHEHEMPPPAPEK